jgi:hypothetical protein
VNKSVDKIYLYVSQAQLQKQPLNKILDLIMKLYRVAKLMPKIVS